MTKTFGARDCARQVLKRIRTEDAYATIALDSALKKGFMSVVDNGLATELVYGVLRNRTLLVHYLEQASTKKLKVKNDVLDALLIAAYQITFLERIPDHAAVDDAVKHIGGITGGRLKGFANGVLRACCREHAIRVDEGHKPPSDYKVRFSVPEWVFDEVYKKVKKDELADALSGLSAKPSVYLRSRVVASELKAELSKMFEDKPSENPYVQSAFKVKGMGSPVALNAWKEGRFVVQDPAAQLVGALVPANAKSLLDVCAGVGGKTFHALDRLDDDARVLACDVSESKLKRLMGGAERLGLKNIETKAGDLQDMDVEGLGDFDAVVVDAPCSGLGVLRRHPEIKWRKEQRQPKDFSSLQSELLNNVAKAVSLGGVIVYSVCTFTDVEGPDVIRRFLGEHNDFQLDMKNQDEDGVLWSKLVNSEGFIETWPHRHDMDGFFAARLKKIR